MENKRVKKSRRESENPKNEKTIKLWLIIVIVAFLFIIYKIFDALVLTNEKIDVSGENYYQYFYGVREEYSGKIELIQNDDDVQFLTDSNETALNKTFVDGSVMKRYTFTLVITKSITDLAIAKDILDNENIGDIADIQTFMDWINEQGDNNNYPIFGDTCVIEEMHTTSENPSLDGINTDVTPALAMYSMEIRIDYIDYSKVIWS